MKARLSSSAYRDRINAAFGQFKPCLFCGTPVAIDGEVASPRPAFPNCGFVQFWNPDPGVVVLTEKGKHVLLGKRAGDFDKSKWYLLQEDFECESLPTPAIRGVSVETGLEFEIRSIHMVVSNLLSPRLHTLPIGLLPEMALEAGEPIIERYRTPKLEEKVTQNPKPDYRGSQ